MIRITLLKKLKGQSQPIYLDVNKSITPGEIVALYGDSGAGKTSILRMIAGLMQAESGKVEVLGDCWFDKSIGKSIKLQDRKVGFVFQDFALFPNMTVKENLAFACANKNSSDRIPEMLDLIEMKELQDTYPKNLSGGQKQRVALVRTLLSDYKLLLLDEPFSSLDDKIKDKLIQYIVKDCKENNITVLIASHNLADIFAMSDKVWLLEEGKICKTGTPYEVFATNSGNGNNLEQIGIVVSIKEGKIVVLANGKTIEIANNNKVKVGQKVLLSSTDFQIDPLETGN